MSISTVTAEALQLKLRQLLPSQQGFGTDLSASDTIIPVIDLTRAAEGSDVPQTLQEALAFGSQTSFDINATTTAIANTPGFYRIFGCAIFSGPGTVSGGVCQFELTDGVSTKVIWGYDVPTGGGTETTISYDFTVFLGASESIQGKTEGENNLKGSSRQIADINGTLVNPSGFTPS